MKDGVRYYNLVRRFWSYQLVYLGKIDWSAS